MDEHLGYTSIHGESRLNVAGITTSTFFASYLKCAENVSANHKKVWNFVGFMYYSSFV